MPSKRGKSRPADENPISPEKWKTIFAAADDRTLDDVGIGPHVRLLLYLAALLPFVGLVIGISYAFRLHSATRKFGWRLVFFSVGLHVFYGACVCPAALLLTLA